MHDMTLENHEYIDISTEDDETMFDENVELALVPGNLCDVHLSPDRCDVTIGFDDTWLPLEYIKNHILDGDLAQSLAQVTKLNDDICLVQWHPQRSAYRTEALKLIEKLLMHRLGNQQNLHWRASTSSYTIDSDAEFHQCFNLGCLMCGGWIIENLRSNTMQPLNRLATDASSTSRGTEKTAENIESRSTRKRRSHTYLSADKKKKIKSEQYESGLENVKIEVREESDESESDYGIKQMFESTVI